MAKKCIRTAALQINRLLANKYKVLAPNGAEIQEAVIPELQPKNHTVILRLRLKGDGWYVFRLGKRYETPHGKGWIVETPTTIARYAGEEDQGPETTADECLTAIIAAPKIYLPDNHVPPPKEDKKYKRKNHLVTCPISMDFNGEIGYSCKNIPPPGWLLHTSWGTIPGSIHMEYLLIPLNGEFQIVEGIAGTHHYHLGMPNTHISLCGKSVMSTQLPLESWKTKSHLKEAWCGKCEEILKKAGIPTPGPEPHA